MKSYSHRVKSHLLTRSHLSRLYVVLPADLGSELPRHLTPEYLLYYPMIRYAFLLIMAVNCLTGHGQTIDAVHDAGVSRELAQLRKQKVKDLRYDLRFSIP